MKSFFEDLGKKIGETTETVTSKAGEMMEIQRLRGQIRTLERGNEADMLEMGRFLYEKYQAGEAMDEQVQMLCEKIDNRKYRETSGKDQGDQRNEYLCRMWKTGSKRDGILSVLRSEKRRRHLG